MRTLVILTAALLLTPAYAERTFTRSQIEIDTRQTKRLDQHEETLTKLVDTVERLERRLAARESRTQKHNTPEPVSEITHSERAGPIRGTQSCGHTGLAQAPYRSMSAQGCGARAVQQAYAQPAMSAGACVQPVQAARACGSRAARSVRRRGLFRRLFQ